MAKTCPSCGYSPIGPYIDNCPICAEPVRNVRSDDSPSFAGPGGLPPLLLAGWIVIGLVLAYFFWEDWPWLLLSLLVCGGAWWAVAREQTTLLQRIVGVGLLVLFVPAIGLAAQPGILPGLDQRDPTERLAEQMFAQIPLQIRQMMNLPSPNTTRTSARLKTITSFLYPAYVLVALPLALLVPPLLSYHQRRQLGGPIWLSKRQALGGLVVWLALLPLAGWLAWPTMRSWAETPNDQLQGSLPPGWPGFPPADPDWEEPEEPEPPG